MNHVQCDPRPIPYSHHLQAAAELVNPFTEPQPSEETGPGAHFGSTFAGMPEHKIGTGTSASHTRTSSNPYRNSPQAKSGASTSFNPIGQSTPPRHANGSPRIRDSPTSRGSPTTKFPDYREAALGSGTHRSRRSSENPPPTYDAVAGSSSGGHRRRTSSLAQRYPGDESHKPLDIIRRDSRKASKPHHLKKRSMQGADIIDRLDPAIGGRPYHHEGPYDAASLARNRDPKYAPVAALETTNSEAIRATPQEAIKDSLDKHMPLDGTAVVPPGQADRLGRTYDYEEGTDMMREGFNGDPGYKQWSGKVRSQISTSLPVSLTNVQTQDYDPDDLRGQGDSFTLDRALRAHKIDDDGGIEMQDSAALRSEYKKQERQGMLDKRDPTTIAGDDSKYADITAANDTDLHKSHSIKDTLKKRVGSLRRKHREE